MQSYILLGLLAILAVFASSDTSNLRKRQKAPPHAIHECIIAVKFQNLDLLDALLVQVSDPSSAKYGQYLSRTEISALISNPAATTAVVSYLRGQGFEDIEVSKYGEFITVQAPISKWEQTLSTEFHHFDRVDRKGVGMQPVMRALAMTMPSELVPHVHAIFNTVQMPLTDHLSTKTLHKLSSAAQRSSRPLIQAANGYVDPDLLKTYYEISKTGNGNSSQSVYAHNTQVYSPDDLYYFEIAFGLPNSEVTDIGGHASSSACLGNMSLCYDANMNMQYITSTARGVPTVFFYDNSTDFVVSWSMRLLSMSSPPLVNSVSFGVNEADISVESASLFDITAKALAVMGVTIVAASGDDGAPGKPVTSGGQCSYNPVWPASSPYVLSVGATQGPESDEPEITCSSSTGCLITSGGGFSNLYARPSWQDSAVSTYFDTVGLSGKTPAAGYNTSGRAYPDVSVMGFNYFTIVGAQFVTQCGTSAATPVVAGMLALVNSARLAANRSALGWVNPTIYANYSMFANDITSGDNLCTSSFSVSTVGECCAEGFYSATGWDPATGVGSVNFKGLFNLFYNLGYSYTPSPSLTPTINPTFAPTTPTARPSTRPTRTPTAPHPTELPTVRPTTNKPTKAPQTVINTKNDETETIIIAVVVSVVGVVLIAGLYYLCCRPQRDLPPDPPAAVIRPRASNQSPGGRGGEQEMVRPSSSAQGGSRPATGRGNRRNEGGKPKSTGRGRGSREQPTSSSSQASAAASAPRNRPVSSFEIRPAAVPVRGSQASPAYSYVDTTGDREFDPELDFYTDAILGDLDALNSPFFDNNYEDTPRDEAAEAEEEAREKDEEPLPVEPFNPDEEAFGRSAALSAEEMAKFSAEANEYDQSSMTAEERDRARRAAEEEEQSIGGDSEGSDDSSDESSEEETVL